MARAALPAWPTAHSNMVCLSAATFCSKYSDFSGTKLSASPDWSLLPGLKTDLRGLVILCRRESLMNNHVFVDDIMAALR